MSILRFEYWYSVFFTFFLWSLGACDVAGPPGSRFARDSAAPRLPSLRSVGTRLRLGDILYKVRYMGREKVAMVQVAVQKEENGSQDGVLCMRVTDQPLSGQ